MNLTDVFSIRSILIVFTSPHVSDNELSDVRPKALVIERQVNIFLALRIVIYENNLTHLSEFIVAILVRTFDGQSFSK